VLLRYRPTRDVDDTRLTSHEQTRLLSLVSLCLDITHTLSSLSHALPRLPKAKAQELHIVRVMVGTYSCMAGISIGTPHRPRNKIISLPVLS